MLTMKFSSIDLLLLLIVCLVEQFMTVTKCFNVTVVALQLSFSLYPLCWFIKYNHVFEWLKNLSKNLSYTWFMFDGSFFWAAFNTTNNPGVNSLDSFRSITTKEVKEKEDKNDMMTKSKKTSFSIILHRFTLTLTTVHITSCFSFCS